MVFNADRLTIHDYLRRWDTDWHWCSEALGCSALGSADFGRERAVQNVVVPIERSAEFLDWFLGTVPVTPPAVTAAVAE